MRIFLSSAVWAVLVIFALAGTAYGQSAAACHCFRDRSYDPSKKFAADEYILVTSFNSLLSAWSGVSKQSLIMAKMSGTGANDLSAALWLGGQTGRSYLEILRIKDNEGSWVRTMTLIGKGSGDDWTRHLLQGDRSDADITLRAEQALLAAYFGVKKERVGQLLGNGLKTREIALAMALSARTGRSTQEIIEATRKGGKSWGEMLNELAMVPEDSGALVESLRPAKK